MQRRGKLSILIDRGSKKRSNSSLTKKGQGIELDEIESNGLDLEMGNKN